MRFLGHLQCQAVANVSGQSHIVACVLEDMVDEAGGGGLTIGTGDADHLRVGVASGEFNLADDGNAGSLHLLHHGCRIRNSGALDNLVGVQDEFLSVVSLFPLDAACIQHFLVMRLDLAHVCDEDIKAFLLCQRCGTYAALCSSEYDYSFHILILFST